MNNYEEWAHLVAKKLQGEADVIAAIDKDELDDAAATEAFVRTVLKPFLPENYGIGAGRVVDAFGNRSDYMDVVIYNRSFPRISLRGTQSDFLYEAVLASFSIRAKYVRKTFFESMDACASMARLTTNVDKTVLVQLARRNGLKPGPNQTFVHDDALRTARFELIGSPPAFMFGFTGIKHSYRQLQENIELWIEQRTAENPDLPMRAFPAVIATQGCFAWRNAAPLALSNREMLGIGNDVAPIRMIVLQLLYLLNRRLNVTTDGYGLKPNLSGYLSQFKPPKFELGIGDVDALVKPRLGGGSGGASDKRLQAEDDGADKHDDDSAAQALSSDDIELGLDAPVIAEPEDQAATSTGKAAPEAVKKAATTSSDSPPAKPEPVKAKAEASEPARPKAEVAKPVQPKVEAAKPAPKPAQPKAEVAKPAPEPAQPKAEVAKPAPEPAQPKTEAAKLAPEPAQPKAGTAESAPRPAIDSAPASSGVFDKPSPFASAPPRPEAPAPSETAAPKAPVAPLGSAPIPGLGDSPAKPPSAPLGSAPIPGLDSAATKDDTPAKPPVAPLGSAPIPGLDSAATKDDTPAKPPVAPLGSAPIPGLDSAATKADEPAKPPVAPLGSAPIPPSQPTAGAETPVDIEVTGEIPLAKVGDKPDFESTVVMAPDPKKEAQKEAKKAGADTKPAVDKTPRKADGTPDFESTMVIAPDATLSKKAEDKAQPPAANSTDAFIDRVKEQLSGSDQEGDREKAYVSTTPV